MNEGSESSLGQLFQRVAAPTAKALSPLVISLDWGIANREIRANYGRAGE